MGGSYTEAATAKLKLKLLNALNKHSGLIARSCKDAGVSRKTYYNWMKSDEEFAENATMVQEFMLDKAETYLHNKLSTDTAALLFYLKCKGKARGYMEKQQVEHSTGDLSTLREAMSKVDSEHEREY